MTPRRRWKQTDQSWLCLQVIPWDKAVTLGSRTRSYRKIPLCALCAFFLPASLWTSQHSCASGLKPPQSCIYSLARGLQRASLYLAERVQRGFVHTAIVSPKPSIQRLWSWVLPVLVHPVAWDKTVQGKKTSNSWGIPEDRDNRFVPTLLFCVLNT